MKSTLFLALTTLLLTFFSSCSAIKSLTSVEKPTLAVNDAKISDISLTDLEITFAIEVDNPNPVAINLASYDFDFIIDGNSFIKGNQPLSTEVKSTSKSIVKIPVRFTFKEFYQTFESLLDKDEASYNLDATIGVNIPILGLTEIPVNKVGMIPVVKPPKISASKLTVKNISFSKADLELQLNINNPNAFGVLLNSLNYNVDINGLESISGTNSETLEISEKGSGVLTIPVSFNLLQLGRTAYQLLNSNKELDYSLSGTANIDATLPLFKPSTYDFSRSGSLNLFK